MSVSVCVVSNKRSLQIVLWRPPGDFVHNLISANNTSLNTNNTTTTTTTSSSSEIQQQRSDDDDDDVMTDNVEPACMTSLMTPASDDDDMDL